MRELFIISVIIIVSSCAIRTDPKFTDAKELPENIGSYRQYTKVNACPELSGVYSKQPRKWGNINAKSSYFSEIDSSRFEYLSIFKGAVETTLKLSETEFSDLTIEQMQIKQQSDEVIQILVRHLQNDTATFMDFVGVTGGYKCKSGVVELQEQIYRGGADGTYVNAKFKTKITLLETDDLVVYQQVATPKRNKHLYYVFKKVQ